MAQHSPLRSRLTRRDAGRAALAAGLSTLLPLAESRAEDPAPTSTPLGGLAMRLKLDRVGSELKLTMRLLNFNAHAVRVMHKFRNQPIRPSSIILVDGLEAHSLTWRSQLSRQELRGRAVSVSFSTIAAAHETQPAQFDFGSFQASWPHDLPEAHVSLTLLTTIYLLVRRPPAHHARLEESIALGVGVA